MIPDSIITIAIALVSLLVALIAVVIVVFISVVILSSFKHAIEPNVIAITSSVLGGSVGMVVFSCFRKVLG